MKKYKLLKPKVSFLNKLRLSKTSRRLIDQKRNFNKKMYKKQEKIDMTLYRALNKKLKKSIKSDKIKNIKYIKKLNNSKTALENPKRMWRFIKNNNLKENLPISNVFTENLTLPSTNLQETENNYFLHFKNLATSINFDPSTYEKSFPIYYEEKITINFDDFQNATKTLHIKKAASLDKIPQEFYTICNSTNFKNLPFTKNLLNTFNNVLEKMRYLKAGVNLLLYLYIKKVILKI